MRKELYVFRDRKPMKAEIRNYREADFAELIRIQRESFPPPFPEELLWNEEQLYNHVKRFPEGALCAMADGRIVGSVTGLLIGSEQSGTAHSWQEVTDAGYIRNHNPSGDTLYIADICVSPEYRKTGLGKWLMQSMYEVVVHLRLRRLLGGGRMPGYADAAAAFAETKEAGFLSAEQYLESVMKGERSDPVISFLLRCGRTPVGVVPDYLEDEESMNYAALMEWKNPFWNGGNQ
ncbi:GNAT family N-acetyltransferase [Paenibacillus gansuensis]|uniref:GNAT family N-acetyltransferase n=1 Tax=Paenibacillus gansuensis TaxID=306542 RepID=A0ABW5PB47_9BACL